MSVKLPNSYSNWSITKGILEKLLVDPSWNNFKSAVLGFINETKSFSSRWICKEDCRKSEKEEEFHEINDVIDLTLLEIVVTEEGTFLTELLPRLLQLALDIEHLFPDGKIQVLRRRSEDKIELSRKQIGCLLSHMFFCTILPSDDLAKEGFIGHFTGEPAPTGPLTFRYLHSWFSDTGPCNAYMRTLIIYFKSIFDEEDQTKLDEEKISFQRLTFKNSELNVSECQNPIVETEVHLNGRIGDVANHVEMDFANKNVGFGRTGTQEELLLGMSPESCVVVIFNETLDNEDAILIQGARIYGTYTGYWHSATFTGPFTESRDWKSRKILAIDALPYPGPVSVQVSNSIMMREVKKALVAFAAVQGEIIDTGHWGCGAFGGDMYVKALVQLLAASMAGVKKLEFYSFGDENFSQLFSTCLDLFKTNDVTVSQLWNLIEEFERENETVGWNRFGQSSQKNILLWISLHFRNKASNGQNMLSRLFNSFL